MRLEIKIIILLLILVPTLLLSPLLTIFYSCRTVPTLSFDPFLSGIKIYSKHTACQKAQKWFLGVAVAKY